MRRVLGLLALMLVASATAFASEPLPVAAPELDGGTALTALALLSGSMVVLRARFKR